VDEWTDIAWLEPSKGRAAFMTDQVVRRALDSFLSERGMSRSQLADDDIRIDMVYLGPAKGTCLRRLMIRTRALSDQG
jgi:hypothetical protein